MKLYKCEFFDEEKCKGSSACRVKYTFDPRHIWEGHIEIEDIVKNNAVIEVDCSNGNCHTNNPCVKFKPYKEES